MSVSVSLGLGQLSATIGAIQSLRGLTRGLLGDFNGDQSADLTTPTGQTLSVNSTEEEIFYGFGEKCKYSTCKLLTNHT